MPRCWVSSVDKCSQTQEVWVSPHLAPKIKPLGNHPYECWESPNGLSQHLLVTSLGPCFLWCWDCEVESEECYKVGKGLTWKGPPSTYTKWWLLILEAKFFSLLLFQEPKQPRKTSSSNNKDILYFYKALYSEKQLSLYNLIWPSYKPNEVVWDTLYFNFTAMKSKKILSVLPWFHSV